MGQTTPNIGIYIPDAGETNYDASFEAGMNNIDAHDHSGGPNKGVPLSSSGLADGSVTKEKLATDVVTSGEGLAIDGGNPNAIIADGILNSLFKIGSNGVLCRTAAGTANARTITGTSNEIVVTNGDGVSGNPTIGIADTVLSSTQPAFYAFLATDATNVTGNGTIYTILCDDVQKNQPSGTPPYTAGTGLFAAPVTGTYLLIGKVRIKDFAGATGFQMRISTTGQLFVGPEDVPVATAAGFYSMSFMCIAPMTATDTASLQVQVTGLAGDTVDVDADANDAVTFFAGYLLF